MTSEQRRVVVAGKPVDRLPSSLFIPPDAMQVFLDVFEGPLDLLHYLIRRDNMDILDIPVAELTTQYLAYVERIIDSQLELAADYLLMSATLIEIKSRMLLPQPEETESEEVDPRRDLVRRLLEYSRIKAAAVALDAQPRAGRDFVLASVARPPRLGTVRPKLRQRDLFRAMLVVVERFRNSRALRLKQENLFSVREAMAHLMACLRTGGRALFTSLLGREHASRPRVAAFFVALLQLTKDGLIRLRQHDRDELIVSARNLH